MKIYFFALVILLSSNSSFAGPFAHCFSYLTVGTSAGEIKQSNVSVTCPPFEDVNDLVCEPSLGHDWAPGTGFNDGTVIVTCTNTKTKESKEEHRYFYNIYSFNNCKISAYFPDNTHVKRDCI